MKNTFVSQNWELLYLGAERLGVAIESDSFTCQRIQINNTRLHAGFIGFSFYNAVSGKENLNGHIKIVDGWHWSKNSNCELTDKQLLNSLTDIQTLINEAKKTVKTNIKFSFSYK